MSHYKVLVVGDNLEEQLAPYDENTNVEAYQDESYEHAAKVKDALTFYNSHPQHRPEVGLDITNERLLLGWYMEGENIRWSEDGTSTLWSTYNPKSKWDYYVTGGRYNASFKILPGANQEDFTPSEHHWSEEHGNDANHASASDRARKRAIDYPTMIAQNLAEGEKEWAKLAAATEGLTPPAYGWSEWRAKYEDIDEARRTWNAHPWNKASSAVTFYGAYEEFHMGAEDPRASYLAHRADFAVTGYYAIVKDGEWIARGDMGWFGMSNDKVSEAEWRAKVREMIEGLPEETWLTTVDCHI